MKIDQVYTPAILLNLDYMEHNLKKYAGRGARKEDLADGQDA